MIDFQAHTNSLPNCADQEEKNGSPKGQNYHPKHSKTLRNRNPFCLDFFLLNKRIVCINSDLLETLWLPSAFRTESGSAETTCTLACGRGLQRNIKEGILSAYTKAALPLPFNSLSLFKAQGLRSGSRVLRWKPTVWHLGRVGSLQVWRRPNLWFSL